MAEVLSGQNEAVSLNNSDLRNIAAMQDTGSYILDHMYSGPSSGLFQAPKS